MSEFSKYKPLLDGHKHVRIAHFLNWASEQKSLKGEAIPYVDVLKVAMQYPRRFRADNPEVREMRRAMGQVRKILEKEYKKGLVTIKNHGVRATVDSLDIARNVVEPTAHRIDTLSHKLNERVKLVDLKEIPDTVDGKKYKAFIKSLKVDMKSLEELTRTMLLLAAPSNS